VNLHTINEAFERSLDAHPDEMFLDCSGVTFTYSEMDREVDKLAGGLQILGIERGMVGHTSTLTENDG
jgi:non-ribosomal peptide synthetase component E (peptide arylation enzyme)